ncbi:copper oxidase [Methyloceanibacter sp.]|uniref:multicopper oxidase family protein n=1 Tax=Methyloceanibacter sp. TaxID=1965321 RepID=UPI002BBC6A62|nr:copper oxidase [Methyloceanibacter sp.]HML93301.1 copper oxidase [Methyloceanibacter sp.]
MGFTRREAVGLGGLAAAWAVLPSRPAPAQTGHEGHGSMDHKGHDMNSMSPGSMSQPGTDDPATTAEDWMSVVRETVHPARTIEPGADVPPGDPGKDYNPVITPNGVTLPFKIVDGVKVFHLVPEEVVHEFAPGLKAQLWGFNGRVHGPTIEAVEGDRIRIYVTNKLPAPTSIHWHGIILPSGMDGVGGLSQKVIQPGETFKYEYPLVQHGTYMYHSHHDEMTQMALGVMGLLVIHPRRPTEPRPHRDFAFMLSEWDIKPGAFRPDPRVFAGFNTLTLNAKAFPGTEALVAKRGDRVRLRLVNLSAMDHHPIHLHGHAFWVAQTDGGMIPPDARWPETTVIVPVGSSRTVDFVADNPGDWAMHCHMTHHVMNQMGHEGPNMIGVDARRVNREVTPVIPAYMTMGEAGMGDMAEMGMHMAVPQNSIPMVGAQGPYDYITMGGMFTILKVRDNLTSYADPGWYRPPAGTVAQLASAQDLKRDGIKA